VAPFYPAANKCFRYRANTPIFDALIGRETTQPLFYITGPADTEHSRRKRRVGLLPKGIPGAGKGKPARETWDGVVGLCDPNIPCRKVDRLAGSGFAFLAGSGVTLRKDGKGDYGLRVYLPKLAGYARTVIRAGVGCAVTVLLPGVEYWSVNVAEGTYPLLIRAVPGGTLVYCACDLRPGRVDVNGKRYVTGIRCVLEWVEGWAQFERGTVGGGARCAGPHTRFQGKWSIKR
jgi:hypothetical protein